MGRGGRLRTARETTSRASALLLRTARGSFRDTDQHNGTSPGNDQAWDTRRKSGDYFNAAATPRTHISH
ncbi:hypothetical protein GCM10010384_48150 [Streptomyces djakartensis]|uniref:Uncharacterized protein n=1 Tax=Streptomyces djakartensis TaxID=68193 RepID=A0ABQ3A4D3_9ACTN|nr:hypothetical protein GCM10010384_48150 [Streptomyces djakartensis]